jgi:hypothetical protein
MLVALALLNAIYLICNPLFSVEFLNFAVADIPLLKSDMPVAYDQILAAISMCLLVCQSCKDMATPGYKKRVQNFR